MTSPTPTDAAAPSPSLSPSPSPLFLTPPSSTRTAPSETPSEPPTLPPTPGLSSDPDDADAYELSDLGSRSSTPSPDSAPPRPKIAALRQIFRQAVRTAGGIANVVVPRAITHNPAETVHQVWVPDEDDEKAIAEPIARMASRRAPAAVSDNPDLLDLGALALALVDYVRKSLAARVGLLPETYVSGPDDGDGSQPVEAGAADLDPADVGLEQQADAAGGYGKYGQAL